MHTVTAHPLLLIGLLLLVVGLALYLGSIALAIARVQGQYSAAMRGRGSLRTGAAFSTASRSWPFLAVALVGGILLILSR